MAKIETRLGALEARVRRLTLLAALALAGGASAGKSLVSKILSGTLPSGFDIVSGRVLVGDRDLVQGHGKPTQAAPIVVYDQGSATPTPRSRKDAASIVIDRDPNALADICDEIAILCAGRLVERAPSRDLIKAPRHPYTQALLDRSGPEDDLGVMPAGCPFRDACPHADPACGQATMRLQMISADHASACVRWRAIWPVAA